MTFIAVLTIILVLVLIIRTSAYYGVEIGSSRVLTLLICSIRC